MLDAVRKFGLEIPDPTPEEKETLEKMKAFIEEIKGTGLTDSDPIVFTGLERENSVIKCPLDDPNPPEICDQIDWGSA